LQDVFTKSELEKLFVTSPEYRNDEHKAPSNFWMPLIGLYTGMRLEEIGQLYVEDVKTFVPLHPFLAHELNFIGYVSSQPKEGRGFLELKYVKDRYTHTFSQWSTRYKKACGIEAPPRMKTFHSLRHTLPTHLKEKEVNDTYISELLGHKHRGMTLGRYAKRHPVAQLYEKAVMMIDFGLDLFHLKSSRFVPK
jgi:integrase